MSLLKIARGVLAGSLKNREADEEERRRAEAKAEEARERAELKRYRDFALMKEIEGPEAFSVRDAAAPARADEAAESGQNAEPSPTRQAFDFGNGRVVEFDPRHSRAARAARETQRAEAEIAATTQAIIDSGIETDPVKARAWAVANPTLDKITKSKAPKAPVRGTSEYTAAVEEEAAARRRGAPPRARAPERPRGPVRGTPEYTTAIEQEERTRQRVRDEAEAERQRNTPTARRERLRAEYTAGKRIIQQRFTGAERKEKLRALDANYEAEKAKIPMV